MMQFFSKIRTLAGLVLILSPLLSLLSSGWPLSFWPPFFCSLMFSLFPLRAAMKRLSFPIWLGLCCILAAAGIFISQQNPTLPALAAPILLGAGSSGILLLLPPWIAVGRYVSAAPFLGLAWSCSLMFSMPLRLLMQYAANVFLPLAVMLTFTGYVLCRRRTPHIQLIHQPPHDFFSASVVKAAVFLLCLLTSMGICLGILLSKSPIPTEALILFYSALACGPILSSWFTEKKGIYVSCILSIFLTEMALLLLCSMDGISGLLSGGVFLFLAAGTSAVIIPVLSYYLCGRTGYIRGLTPLILCVPVSLLFSWPFWNMAFRKELIQQDTAAFLLFLLVMSFFCIFFAWKKRFVILKNRRI